MDEISQSVGNDTSPATAQTESGTEQQINPGAIRKSTTSSLLNALSNASGQQFESVEAALAYVTRTAAQSGGNVQPVESNQTKSSGRTTNNDLHEQFNKLQQDLNRKDQALRERDLDSDIQRAMSDKFDPDLVDYALTKVKASVQWSDDGTYTIVNAKGQERYGADGNPLTINGLVQEVAKGNPKLLKQSNLPGGSGLRPGQGKFAGAMEDGIPDYSKDPAAFNSWAARNGLGKNIGLKGTNVSATVSGQSQKIL